MKDLWWGLMSCLGFPYETYSLNEFLKIIKEKGHAEFSTTFKSRAVGQLILPDNGFTIVQTDQQPAVMEALDAITITHSQDGREISLCDYVCSLTCSLTDNDVLDNQAIAENDYRKRLQTSLAEFINTPTASH
jgi:hypothetical protein